MNKPRCLLMLGRRICDMRQRRGWTQVELAAASGLVQSSVCRYEKSGRMPTLPVLIRLAVALEVSSDYLLGIAP